MTDTSMYNYLFDRLRGFSDRTALIFLGKKISFAAFANQVDCVAEGLSRLGVGKGDSVTIALPNSPSAVVAFYAVNRLGAIANMVHPFTPALQMLDFMKKADSKLVFLNDFAYFRHKQEIEKSEVRTVICRFQDYMPKIKGAFFGLVNRKKTKQIDYKSDKILKYSDLLKTPPCTQQPDSGSNPAVYLHSGGTTGQPKTVVLSGQPFNEIASNVFDWFCLQDVAQTKGKVMLSVLPMFHGFGLGVCIHMALSSGMSSLLIPKFTGNTALKAIKKHKADVWIGVPTMFGRLVNNKRFGGKYLGKVTNIFCGADSMPKNLKQKFEDALAKYGSPARVCEGYGLTEAGSVVCVNTHRAYKEGSVGRASKGMEIRAYDNEKERFCQAGESGEIVVKGSQVMRGYLKDKEATEKTMQLHDGEIWVHTGDFGFVDSEGFVFFRQRIKRIVKISGVAIFPSEIEDVVTALPFVKHACAVGVKREKSGSAIRLYVELQEGAAADEQTKQKILTECRKRIIKWAIPREVIFTPLPLTLMGKVDFKQLEEN